MQLQLASSCCKHTCASAARASGTSQVTCYGATCWKNCLELLEVLTFWQEMAISTHDITYNILNKAQSALELSVDLQKCMLRYYFHENLSIYFSFFFFEFFLSNSFRLGSLTL